MGTKSSRASDLLNNEQTKDPVEQNNNEKEKDEKEAKAKKKYYGKFFVIFIFFVIIYQYYTYVYLIMWKKIQRNILTIRFSKNKIK